MKKNLKVGVLMLELNRIYNEDCLEGMKKLPNNFVDLIVTSPPYNLSIKYNSYEDNMPYETYLNWVRDWLSESLRVLKDGGRICVNIPMESNLGGKKYIMNDYINVFESLGFVRNSIAIWNKQNLTSRTAWGSWKSPSCPNIINPLEVVVIYSKGTRKKEGKKEDIDITKEEFVEYSLGVWNFNAEKAKKIGHPAPFPKDLPYRCVKMFSYKNDIVMDIFMGSGTTAIAAINTNRNFIGFELDSEYHRIATERIQNECALLI
jgi:site-specific DNA-methyltransferase (adenine-specific)